MTIPDHERAARGDKARTALPYTVLSCSMSLDGYIGAPDGGRLVLSNGADFDRVDAVRASCDAIMVGAGTVRSDNPRLAVRDRRRKAARLARGLSATPAKVTVTASGNLPSDSAFFVGDADRIVYCPSDVAPALGRQLGSRATVVGLAMPLRLREVAADLRLRDVERLMVEGGGRIHTQFLVDDLADELHLVIAPVFVGDGRARRFVDDGAFPWHPRRRGTLIESRQIGDVVLARYALSDRCRLRPGDDVGSSERPAVVARIPETRRSHAARR